MLRCKNDVFGYCSGKPKVKTTIEQETYIGFGGRQTTCARTVYSCKLDLKTCGFYLTQTELQARNTASILEPIAAPTTE